MDLYEQHLMERLEIHQFIDAIATFYLAEYQNKADDDGKTPELADYLTTKHGKDFPISAYFTSVNVRKRWDEKDERYTKFMNHMNHVEFRLENTSANHQGYWDEPYSIVINVGAYPPLKDWGYTQPSMEHHAYREVQSQFDKFKGTMVHEVMHAWQWFQSEGKYLYKKSGTVPEPQAKKLDALYVKRHGQEPAAWASMQVKDDSYRKEAKVKYPSGAYAWTKYGKSKLKNPDQDMGGYYRSQHEVDARFADAVYEYGVNWHTRTQTDFASFWNFIRNHLTGDEDNKYNIPEDLLKHYKVRASKVYADKHEKEPKAMSDNDIAKLVWVGGDDVPSITGTVEMQIRQAVMQHVLFGEEYAYDIDEVVADAVRYVFRRLSKVPGIYRNRVEKIKAVIEPKIARYSRNFEQKFRKEYEGKQPR